MPYTEETLKDIEAEYTRVTSGLRRLVETLLVYFSCSLTDERSEEFLKHGVCRRLQVMERCIHSIYTIFPPDRKKPLGRDELSDVQINLHAFVINLFGILDNLAWVFVLEHDLEKEIGGRKRIGLFIEATQERLPKAIQDYLNMENTKTWYKDYVQNYRDALAHRIPLYVPPFMLSKENGERWKELDARIAQCMKNLKFELLNELQSERDSLGVACDMFSHSFSEIESKTIYIHSQLLVDGSTILELSEVYVKHFQA